MNSTEFVNSLFNLEGHVGIVTGASRGIGAGIARIISQAGATVYDLDVGEPADEEQFNEKVRFVKIDLTDRAACKKVIEEIVAKEGQLDFLINNAGITHKQRAEEFDMDRYKKIQDINLETLFELCRMCYPYLKQSKYIGRILSISSMGAHMGFNGVVPYCITKSGVLGLTRGLATEWAHDNILVNSVAPGWVLTKLNADMFEKNPDRKEAAWRKFPMDRFGTPEDIGNMMLFLLSGASTYLTGQDFAVDGGALAYGF
ncbi:MAG: SDR family NAD(P)-dependent oxidoreductase [Anaerotruncus rubiinfantis]|uniref:SDR family NAD(P)-dependent oxidoreductase n=1 Tax=Anaerotruncus rubiinfantis TaxID=1720200 RepID=UPI001FABB70E|nr:SDR family oxidoreductase [Anaerotruncus rubiinfantis]